MIERNIRSGLSLFVSLIALAATTAACEAEADPDIVFRPDNLACASCTWETTPLNNNASPDVVFPEASWGAACPNIGRFRVWYDDGADWYADPADQTWTRDSTNVAETADCNDQFGAAVHGGDFDNDGYGDFAVGVPGDTVSGTSSAGSIHLFYGSATGITATDDHAIFQSDFGQTNEVDDFWGERLATGDFNGDGKMDVAIGAPREGIGSLSDAGAVSVLYGASAGITTTGAQAWSQDSTNVEDAAEAGDQCGAWVTAGDFNDDGYADLAFGCPGEEVGAISNAGAVNVLYRSSGGITATGDQLWHQDVPGINGTSEANDEFGWFILAGDYSGDGVDDLIVAVDDGCTHGSNQAVIRGSGSGLTSTSNSVNCVSPPAGGACTGCTASDVEVCTCDDAAECASLTYAAGATLTCATWYDSVAQEGASYCTC
jgi:hypothetical protein